MSHSQKVRNLVVCTAYMILTELQVPRPSRSQIMRDLVVQAAYTELLPCPALSKLISLFTLLTTTS